MADPQVDLPGAFLYQRHDDKTTDDWASVGMMKGESFLLLCKAGEWDDGGPFQTACIALDDPEELVVFIAALIARYNALVPDEKKLIEE